MKTLIAVPCLEMVHADFMESMMQLDRPEETAYAQIKNTLVHFARNTIAQNAVRMGFDRVMWFDSDITFPHDIISRLAEDMDGRDYVSGLYVMRNGTHDPVIYSDVQYNVTDQNVTTGGIKMKDYPKDSVFEIAGSGFGCVMTSYRLLKAMVDRYGAPFTPLIGMGEDLSFCFRAKQAGFRMYCDSRIRCGHIGTIQYKPEE
jgi:spore maturation protein CgeB